MNSHTQAPKPGMNSHTQALNDAYKPTQADTADLCDAAADYLDEHGWIRFGTGGAGGPACMLGALHTVAQRTGGKPDQWAYDGATQAIRRQLGGKRPLLTVWNDTVARDRRTVTRLLRATARGLRSDTPTPKQTPISQKA